MKCPDCTRQLECVPHKKDGMWSNQWECKEHGKIDHKAIDFKMIAQGNEARSYKEMVEEYFVQVYRAMSAIDHIDIKIDLSGIKTESEDKK